MPGPCRSRTGSTCSPQASARRSASRYSARIWAKWITLPGRSSQSSKRCRELPVPTRNAPPAGITSISNLTASALARYGLAVGDLLEVISVALGGEMLTTTVEGRERFGVTVRYPRELRQDPLAIATQVLVPLPNGGMIPLRPARERQDDQGATQHSHRKRAAVGLYFCRHSQPRHRRLRGRGAKGGT